MITFLPLKHLRFAQPQRGLRLWGLAALGICVTLSQIHQVIFSQCLWMGNAPLCGGGKIKALWEERLKACRSLRRVQKVCGALCRTLEVLVHRTASKGLSVRPG